MRTIYEVELKTVSGDKIPFTELHYFYDIIEAKRFIDTANKSSIRSAQITQVIDL